MIRRKLLFVHTKSPAIVNLGGVEVAFLALGLSEEMNSIGDKVGGTRRPRIIECNRVPIHPISIWSAPFDKDVRQSVQNVPVIRISVPGSCSRFRESLSKQSFGSGGVTAIEADHTQVSRMTPYHRVPRSMNGDSNCECFPLQ